ncbi:unnamed protein product [Diplocarpon coronariae]
MAIRDQSDPVQSKIATAHGRRHSSLADLREVRSGSEPVVFVAMALSSRGRTLGVRETRERRNDILWRGYEVSRGGKAHRPSSHRLRLRQWNE